MFLVFVTSCGLWTRYKCSPTYDLHCNGEFERDCHWSRCGCFAATIFHGSESGRSITGSPGLQKIGFHCNIFRGYLPIDIWTVQVRFLNLSFDRKASFSFWFCINPISNFVCHIWQAWFSCGFSFTCCHCWVYGRCSNHNRPATTERTDWD